MPAYTPPLYLPEPSVPHSPAEKNRVTTRQRRIQGQALALERAVNEGTECGALLMAEVLESHLRETFLQSAQGGRPGATIEPEAEIDQIMRIVRSYLK